MACETAVLSTDCPSGPAEILGGGRFGVLCPTGDVNALAVEIAKFVTDAGHANRYTSIAADHVRQNFSMATAAERLGDLLETAAATRQAE
jgi:glycosyltransferase involved in cell wall biosynthesis